MLEVQRDVNYDGGGVRIPTEGAMVKVEAFLKLVVPSQDELLEGQ